MYFPIVTNKLAGLDIVAHDSLMSLLDLIYLPMVPNKLAALDIVAIITNKLAGLNNSCPGLPTSLLLLM